MTYLLTLAQLKTRLDLSARITDQRFRYFLRQVQEFDVKDLFAVNGCEAFYHDVLRNIDNPGAPEYALLVAGENYTDADGYERRFEGLGLIIAEFWWARYLVEGHMIDTGLDVVQKSDDYSEPISGTQRERSRARHHAMAVNYWPEVVKYLDTKATGSTFIVYQNCGCSGRARRGGLKADTI